MCDDASAFGHPTSPLTNLRCVGAAEKCLRITALPFYRVMHNSAVNRRYLASQVMRLSGPVVAFRKYVFSDVLPAFGDLEARAQDFARDYYDHIGALPAGEDEIDMADVAEEANQRAYDWWGMMTSLRQSMLNLMAAGLFHLVEQQLAQLSRDRFFDRPIDDTKISAVSDWYRDQLRIEFRNLGSWEVIDEMRLVANTVKHGEGRSANELRKLNPDLFVNPDLQSLYESSGINAIWGKLSMRLAAPLSGADFFVTEEILERYAKGAERFFREIAAELSQL